MKEVIAKALLRAAEIDCGKGESVKRQKMFAALSAVAVEANLPPSVQLQMRTSLQLFDTRIPKQRQHVDKKSVN